MQKTEIRLSVLKAGESFHVRDRNQALTNSIRDHGLIHMLTVNGLTVVSGNARLAALKELIPDQLHKHFMVPCMVLEPKQTEEVHERRCNDQHGRHSSEPDSAEGRTDQQ